MSRAVSIKIAVSEPVDRIFRELPALLRGAALFVGGDSGPLKVAEAVGARTLSFWASGATAAAFAGPRGSGHVALPFDSDAEQAAAAARALLSAS